MACDLSTHPKALRRHGRRAWCGNDHRAGVKPEPNEFAAKIHDRMPAFLTQEQFEPWLSGTQVSNMRPAPNDLLQRWPVSKRVNSSKADADDPTLIDAVQAIA